MKNLFRVILSVIAGLVLGSVVNMMLITISGHVIPAPAGADVTTMEGLRASLHLFEPRHFLFPFLAHALGTLVGALAASLLAPVQPRLCAYAVGVLFLAGGITNVMLLPAPLWFSAVDLLLAYLPAAWLGHAGAVRIKGRSI